MESKLFTFPLYQQLSNCQQKENNWDKICATINNLSLAESEIIYALMYHHHIINDSDKNDRKQTLYGSRICNGGKGLIFTVKQLPESLQKIIANYVSSI